MKTVSYYNALIQIPITLMLSQLINNSPSNEMQMTRGKINHELTNFLCEVASRNLAISSNLYIQTQTTGLSVSLVD